MIRQSLLLPTLFLLGAAAQAQTPIPCGGTPLLENYCYGPNELQTWSYETDGTGTLRLVFVRGTIQSGSFDSVTIYDGPDSGGPILFSHTQTSAYNLGPPGSAINNTLTNFHSVDVISTTGAIFMVLESNATTHCGATASYDPWQWNVFCYDCVAPQATATVVEDCDAGTFNLNVNVTSTGSAPNVGLVHSVNNNIPVTQSGVTTGNWILGPYTLGAVVNLTVKHGTDALCDISLGDFTDTATCPLHVVCGGPALNQEYCYGPNENTAWLYQADGEGTLRLLFLKGTIQSATFDRVRIYDGADQDAPLLFAHTQTAAYNLGPVGSNVNNTFSNFHAVDVFSTTGQILMVLESNATTHCGTTSTYDPWQWHVMCLDCDFPVAEATVIQDCDLFQYYLEVDVTSLGTAQEATITSTLASTPQIITSPGAYTVGPFESAVPVQVTVQHDANNLCDLVLPEIVNPVCPTNICGPIPLTQNYCYGPNENTAWAWQVPQNAQIRLVFQKGTIQTSSSDRLWIYDGPDAESPLLFAHTNTAAFNLGPTGSAVNNAFTNYHEIDVTATGTNIYMVLTSNATVHCGTTATYDPWEWTVECIGCVAPGISYELIPDCERRSFQAQVMVDGLTGPAGFQITESYSGTSLPAEAPGTLNFGNIMVDQDVVFEISDLNVANCIYVSDTMTITHESCIYNTCGIDDFSLCYENNDERWYTYRSTDGVPISIGFLAGHMLPGDRILIYNGLSDVGSAVLYQGNNQQNLAGIIRTSSNVHNALTLRVSSDPGNSCEDGQTHTPLHWEVGCGMVGMEEGAMEDFSLYPNPASDLLTIEPGMHLNGQVILRLLDMSGRTIFEQTQQIYGSGRIIMDLGRYQNGQYLMQMITDEWISSKPFHILR